MIRFLFQQSIPKRRQLSPIKKNKRRKIKNLSTLSIKRRSFRKAEISYLGWYLHNGQNNRINEAPTNWKRCERNKDIFNRKVKKDLQKVYESVIIYI